MILSGKITFMTEYYSHSTENCVNFQPPEGIARIRGTTYTEENINQAYEPTVIHPPNSGAVLGKLRPGRSGELQYITKHHSPRWLL